MTQVPATIVKRCSKCKTEGPPSMFYRNRRTRDGLSSWCRSCSLESTRQNQARRRNEIGDEAWRALNRATTAAWRTRNGGADKPRNEAWYAASRRLRELHPDTWERLYAEERYARGLPI